MTQLINVWLAMLSAFITAFIFLAAMDREVARKDYNANVDQCKPIDGCLFGLNCRHYNKMIEEACND